MVPEKTYSIYEIWKITRQIEQENFVLANVARMVYFTGFHKNEIENIKINDAFRNNTVSSIIEPFLKSTKKAYTKMPIILESWPRRILGNHIKQLERGGYAIDDEAPLFPDPKTKESYNVKTLQRRFNEYFKDINFDDLRKFGIEREQGRLKAKYKNTQKFKDELIKYSRHSRLSTTQQFIGGKVQRPGKPKKKDLPWEIIVGLIEWLPKLDMVPKDAFAQIVREKINTEIKEKDVRKSLDALLNAYMKELNSACPKKPDFGRKRQEQVQDRSLSSVIRDLKPRLYPEEENLDEDEIKKIRALIEN
jgi:hypothetical protein